MFRLSAPRDEREAHLDQAADRFAYLAVSYLALGLVLYRSLVDHATAWDPLALVVGGGVAGAAYRLRAGVVTRSWLTVVGITLLLGIGIAMVAVALAR